MRARLPEHCALLKMQMMKQEKKPLVMNGLLILYHSLM